MSTTSGKPKLFTGATGASQKDYEALSVFEASTQPTPPKSFLKTPAAMSYWGNQDFGDCVSAEEAFAKAITNVDITWPVVETWAAGHKELNGASILAVLEQMQTDGFQIGDTLYNNGEPISVPFDTASFQAAIFHHTPLKLGINADWLEQAVAHHDNDSGWILNLQAGAVNGQKYVIDHCVSVCGYGNYADLSGLLMDAKIANVGSIEMDIKNLNGLNILDEMCYAVFTWNSIGIISEQTLFGISAQAYVRNPTTVTKNVS